jgi:hypothetical protein
MRSLFRRIAVNGLLTAAILAAMGYLYAELATIWLIGSTPAATESAQAAREREHEVLRDSLRIRVPLTMAICGLAFIALAEFGLYLWRGHPVVIEKKPAERSIDPAEKLLEELLAQADAAMASKNAAVEAAKPTS